MLLRNLALATTLAVGAPAAAFAAPEAPAAVETVKVKAPQASPSDATNYAEREKQDQKASSFQGGDVVVVGISGGAILVLLLLLLILA
jgi:curli biogenesis system outer membrane secretion channel CsgG